MAIAGLAWERYSLPLKAPLTSQHEPVPGRSRYGEREGLLLTLTLTRPDGSTVTGVGEVAPLPGVHKESLMYAAQQVVLVSGLLARGGVSVPVDVVLLGGRLRQWMDGALGLKAGWMVPSVR